MDAFCILSLPAPSLPAPSLSSHDDTHPLRAVSLGRVKVTNDIARPLSKRKLQASRHPIVFHEQSTDEERAELTTTTARLDIPFVYCPYFSGLAASARMELNAGDVLASSYTIEAVTGSGSFATAYRARSLHHDQRPVCLKVLRNTKDVFDAGLVEIRMLTTVAANDPHDTHHLLRVLDYFYASEHLIVVTELLNCSVLDHYMDLQSRGERQQYYNAPTLAALSAQILDAIKFLHTLGITHADVKPANVCIVNTHDRRFKLIDLGAALLVHDTHTSYIMSRWYRAPEVMLGLEWGQTIDEWAFACLLVELALGFAIFSFGSVEHVLAAQIAMRGPIPSWMLDSDAGLPKMYLTDEGMAYEVDLQGAAPGVYMIQPGPGSSSLRELMHNKIDPTLFGSIDAFATFVEPLLEIDPRRRVSAACALENAFVARPSAGP